MALNMGVENISYSDDYVTRIIVEVKKKSDVCDSFMEFDAFFI